MQPLVEVHDALRADPGNRQIAQLTGSAPRRVTIETPPVTGPVEPTDPVTPFKIAGDEYVVINGSDLLGDAATAAATVQLDLSVEGQQVEGPRLAVVGASSSPSPTAQPSESATEPAGPADESDGSGIPALVWVLLVAVALGGVVAGLVARRGRARPRG
jgi:hypothetical protein